jgi:hypothetical protein
MRASAADPVAVAWITAFFAMFPTAVALPVSSDASPSDSLTSSPVWKMTPSSSSGSVCSLIVSFTESLATSALRPVLASALPLFSMLMSVSWMATCASAPAAVSSTYAKTARRAAAGARQVKAWFCIVRFTSPPTLAGSPEKVVLRQPPGRDPAVTGA